MTDANAAWPLEGIRVLDLGQIYNGPYAGFLLAHAGADVVKVEPPGGEALRKRGGLGVPMSFAMLNTNKRGLVLDLKHPRGKALLIDLVQKADVLLENFAPGAMERLGLGAAAMRKANPRLIYASGTGYGLSGPDKDNLAMDLTVQAIGGVMSINGPQDGPPLKTGLAICDFLGAVHLYAGITTALYERERTGIGRMVEVAMQEALYPALASNIASLQRNNWQQPERRGNRHPTQGSAPYNVYPCTDGHIAIICVNEAHWTNLLTAIGREDVVDDERFATQSTRAKHEDAVDGVVAPWAAKFSKSQAADILKQYRVPAAPVRDLVEVTADAHMHARGMLHDIEHPDMGSIVLPTSPLRFSGSPPPEIRPEPKMGEHVREILAQWLEMDAREIRELKDDGVFG
jgi:crotonobetainyl-CoA:carnitine CoA-transferase CaiB-like acyl-CoA transferase